MRDYLRSADVGDIPMRRSGRAEPVRDSARQLSPVEGDSAAACPARSSVPVSPGATERIVPLPTVSERTALYAELRGDGELWMTRCAWCGRTRSVEGIWRLLSDAVRAQIRAATTHGICPDCATGLLPGG